MGAQMSRATSIIQLVYQYGHSDTSAERFALFEAIQNGIWNMDKEVHFLTPFVCCQDFDNCKKSDCVPLLNRKLKDAIIKADNLDIELDNLRMTIVDLEADLKEDSRRERDY